MKSDESKQAYLMALTNAAEFIRQHGEEGGIDEEDYPVSISIYLREKQRVANMLEVMAERYAGKHGFKPVIEEF